MDCRYESSDNLMGGMGVPIGGRGLGGGGSLANEGVNLEAAGYHCGVYFESSHL